MSSRQVLVVLDEGGAIATLLELPHEPNYFSDLVRAAGDRALAPAGPALIADGLVLHRARGQVDHTSEGWAARTPQLDALVQLAQDEESGMRAVPAERAPWCRPGWAARTTAWVDEVLAARGAFRTAAPEVKRSWALSHVERVPTSGGDLYLKAAAAHFAQEPPITRWLAERFPGDVPDVFAIDADLHCMLMAALPAEESTPAALPLVAATLARIQIDCANHHAELRELGAPPRSLARTSDAFTDVAGDGLELDLLSKEMRQNLHAAVPWVLDRLAELDAIGLPDTLVHGDLHLGNVSPAGDHVVLFDWSDACVSHPFMDAAHLIARLPENPEQPQRTWLEPYLETWRAGWQDATLRRAVDLARVGDLAFQAVTYERLQRSLAPDDRPPLTGLEARRLSEIVRLADESRE